MIILTLFGTTTGLELLNIPLANNVPPLKLEDAWIGVTPSQLTLHPDKDVYLVFRRSVSGHLVTWIGLYRPVREMGYDRAGTFYGAGVWVIDGAVDAKTLIVLLREMLDQVQVNAIQGDRFVKRLADVRGQFTPPSQVSALIGSHSKINSGIKPEGESGFIVEATSSIDVIEWAQRASSANYFAKIVVGAIEQAPNSGQSSGFKVFPSLSMAIDASYQRLSSDYRNRFQDLSQNIKSLEKKNTAINSELQNTLIKLQQSESARELSAQKLRESQSNNYALYERNNNFGFQSGLIHDSDFGTSVTQKFPSNTPTTSSISSDSFSKERTAQVPRNFTGTPINSPSEQRPKRKIVEDKPYDIISLLLVAAIIVMIVIIATMWFTDNNKCKSLNPFCEPERTSQRSPNSFPQPGYSTDDQNSSGDPSIRNRPILGERQQSENNLTVNKEK